MNRVESIVQRIHSRLNAVPISWKILDEAIQSASAMIATHEQSINETKRANSEQGSQSVRNEYKYLEVTQSIVDEHKSNVYLYVRLEIQANIE
jgi:hypothetical protein